MATQQGLESWFLRLSHSRPYRHGRADREHETEQQHFYIECGKGWTFYMTNLKSILEGGLDLRNKNINLKQVINA